MSWHYLKFQVTIPAHLTRTPRQAMEKVITGAVKHLNSMVPQAYDREFKPMYVDRKTKLGVVWDLLVVMKFRHRGPLPPAVAPLVTHHKILTNLLRNAAN